MKRKVVIYSRNNRCPVTRDYDPFTVSPYGSKWVVRIYENGRVTAKLVQSNIYVNDEKVEKSIIRCHEAGVY